ncbi:hypothetical protein [Streptomyces eurythermus]
MTAGQGTGGQGTGGHATGGRSTTPTGPRTPSPSPSAPSIMSRFMRPGGRPTGLGLLAVLFLLLIPAALAAALLGSRRIGK